MTILNSVGCVAAGFGSGDYYQKREGVTTNVGATAITIPSSGNLSPTARSGRIRVKSATIGTNATFIVGKITATDGSSTVQLYGGDTAATSAGVGLSFILDFITDLNLTIITVNVTIGTANSTVDVELVYSS